MKYEILDIEKDFLSVLVGDKVVVQFNIEGEFDQSNPAL